MSPGPDDPDLGVQPPSVLFSGASAMMARRASANVAPTSLLTAGPAPQQHAAAVPPPTASTISMRSFPVDDDDGVFARFQYSQLRNI
jgi:hypothetical protein